MKIPFPGRKRLGRKAIAAVEFAICAPILLILFMGTIEILMLYRTEAKLNVFTSNYAQMVSWQETAEVDQNNGTTPQHYPVPTNTTTNNGIIDPGLTDLCQGAVYGLQPFPPLGLTLDVASVTVTSVKTTTSNGVVTTTPQGYDTWEVDMDNTCKTKGTQVISATGAVTLAVGNGTSTAMVQGLGDNIIIVKAQLQYPGVLGIILTTAQTLGQTAVARWRYATQNNISNDTTKLPSTTLEFLCAGTGCTTYSCTSASACTVDSST